jgi:hypothetical protein
VEADDFALGLKGFPIHLLDVLISHIVQNIVAKDFDIKTGDSFGEAFSCIAIANDAYGSSGEFPSSVAFPIPPAGLNGGMSWFESVHQGQKHAQGVFSYCISIALGRIDQMNVTGFYGF